MHKINLIYAIGNLFNVFSLGQLITFIIFYPLENNNNVYNLILIGILGIHNILLILFSLINSFKEKSLKYFFLFQLLFQLKSPSTFTSFIHVFYQIFGLLIYGFGIPVIIICFAFQASNRILCINYLFYITINMVVTFIFIIASEKYKQILNYNVIN